MAAASPETVTIEAIGHRGDGIAQTADGPVFVPFTLPGESVSILRNGTRGRLLELLTPSAQRVAPPCRHFGRCGGCALQMMPIPATREFKRDLVMVALAAQRIDTEVTDTVGVGLASRRRAVLTAVRAGRGILLGYNERLSNRLVDIEECPILADPLAGAVAGLRALIEPLVPARKPARVTVLLTRTGLDVDIAGAQDPSPRLLSRLVEAVQAAGVARLSAAGEPILTLAEPIIDVAGVALTPPPGAFVQASAEAEAIMAELVIEHLSECRRVADLFSGFGPFALAIARRSSVRAVENSAPALEALAAATRRASGLKRIETERRDLFAFPLAPAELNRFDGIVFDPPRAGAQFQAEALAGSRVPRIAAVSCNPASFARDARILIDGGYTLERVVPVDQFVYSAEIEVVGLFSRR